MMQREAIAAAKRGERVSGGHSLHKAEKPEAATCPHNLWRTLFCDSSEDVVECSVCGKQEVVGCNFDEEYA